MLSFVIAGSMLVTDLRPVYQYQRTNGNGSEAESVFVFVKAPGRVSVMKEKSRCSNAAYVSATLDPATGQAQTLIGGRLARDLSQQPFAWLTTNAAGSKLEVRVGSADARPSSAIPIGKRWHLYDFDFADMIAHPPSEIGAMQAFAFDLPLILSGDDGFDLTHRGQLILKSPVRTRHFGTSAIRYRASGAAGAGSMWFDARSGVLLEARLPLANHREYRDFRLRLIQTRYGETAWRSALRTHWQGCPSTH